MPWSDEDLRAAVERLAASPERQLEWLRELGTLPSLDELALEFDDEFCRMRSTVDRTSSMRALTALDEQLSLMGGPENAGLWRPGALDGAEWSRVRELAVSALSELDG
jgi:hypothetical protein